MSIRRRLMARPTGRPRHSAAKGWTPPWAKGLPRCGSKVGIDALAGIRDRDQQAGIAGIGGRYRDAAVARREFECIGEQVAETCLKARSSPSKAGSGPGPVDGEADAVALAPGC